MIASSRPWTDISVADIFGSGDPSDSVAEQWLTRYREDDCAAVTELVNCVLQCSGCDIQVTEDDIRDPDNCQNRLADIQSVWQDVSRPPISIPLCTQPWEQF